MSLASYTLTCFGNCSLKEIDEVAIGRGGEGKREGREREGKRKEGREEEEERRVLFTSKGYSSELNCRSYTQNSLVLDTAKPIQPKLQRYIQCTCSTHVVDREKGEWRGM